MHDTLLQVLPVLGAFILLRVLIRIGRLARQRIALQAPVGPYFALVAGFVAYLLVLEVISWRVGLLTAEVKPWQFGPWTIALRILGIGVLTPFVEEVIFRGVLQGALQSRTTAVVAIVGQALVFTLCHALALVDSHTVVFDIAQLFAEGAYYGWARLLTRSLYPSMAMHAMGNAMAVAERLMLG